MADKKKLDYLQSVGPDQLKASLLEIVEMLTAQIEAGNVDSLVVLFAADKDEDNATFGGRHLIRPRHMDFLEDTFKDAMQKITDETGVTAHSMREARAEALERMRSGKTTKL